MRGNKFLNQKTQSDTDCSPDRLIISNEDTVMQANMPINRIKRPGKDPGMQEHGIIEEILQTNESMDYSKSFFLIICFPHEKIELYHTVEKNQYCGIVNLNRKNKGVK